jgi:hypothetical protein
MGSKESGSAQGTVFTDFKATAGQRRIRFMIEIFDVGKLGQRAVDRFCRQAAPICQCQLKQTATNSKHSGAASSGLPTQREKKSAGSVTMADGQSRSPNSGSGLQLPLESILLGGSDSNGLPIEFTGLSSARSHAMSAPRSTNRRDFLKVGVAAGFAVPHVVPAAALGRDGRTAASERISLGIIGVNGMGRGNLANCARHEDVVVTAVCDVWKARMDPVVEQFKDTAKGASRLP